MDTEGAVMSARMLEAALLARIRAVARTEGALDQREANVFRLAALLVRARHPRSSADLMLASEHYFRQHPLQRLSPEDVVRKGWVTSLPRLRDLLNVALRDSA